MTAATAYALVGLLLAGVLAAAFVSRNESRQDFILRQQVGDFEFDGPQLNPPEVDGPEIDGPDVNGPDVAAPDFSWVDVAYYLMLVICVVALIAGLIAVLQRFGPGAPDDVAARTSRLGPRHNDPAAEGEHGWAAFERFCYTLLQDPDPSRAVRVAMRYAEAGFGRLQPRIADETPSEWLRRVRADQPQLAPLLGPIVASYQAVRFAGSGASPAERDGAVNGLRQLARAACGDRPPEAPDLMPAVPGSPT